eukprot:Protomagalhaensia_wolfi_Nauph_80__3957@NODE_400_length_2604_cov_10_079922_g302_i0_p1_GENE_NODE_400_length_2604_cov_10_079922_g302_i0NODE_400_length_2604_cov_10_079922_g302_i0_p1_ORF_typecomplete_len571_score109_00LMBR1/PF04791_16/6_3e31LMBR1/PF04791_16/5_6e02DUF2226/PF09987_9/0_21MtrG/PF04210_13/8_8e03MtrG/PF04210_13/1_8e04MtrG/PF04210_13/0_39PTPRCAP/PF15713_5/0_71S1FA/PF04689_13/5S1FA/PF04689_13/2_9e03S1FA/PF04689_13/1_1e04S1FA/PF04689_13/9e02_NODE_400_length_2604_cov_10_079922_g302_i08922547
MFHWWVILIIAGYNLILFFGGLRFVYHYMHTDDFRYNQGILGQIVAVLGIQITFFLLCLVPTDVYNAKFDAGYSMLYFWQLVYLFVVVYLSVVLPYGVYFYEADSDPRITKVPPWRRALYLTGITGTVAWAIIGILYLITYKVTVPVETTNSAGITTTESQTVRVSFLTFLIATPGFAGWLMFAFQGGIGLASFPLSLIQSYIHRPRPISQAQYEKSKRILGERATLLRGVGETLRVKEQKFRESHTGIKGTRARLTFRQKLSKFNQVVTLLESEYNALETSYKKRGRNPIVAALILCGGIFAAILTIAWICQIVLAIIWPQVSGRDVPFGLMGWVLGRVSDASLLAPDLIIYSILCGYLVLVALHGNIRVSLRFQSCLPLEPLKKNDTHLNALLFHTSLFLMCTCAVVKLSLDSFARYSDGTEAKSLFSLPNEYMRLFSKFYKHNVFEWMMLVVTTIAFVWLMIFPEDKPAYNVNDPKTQQKWLRLQKELGIKDPNQEQVEEEEEQEQEDSPQEGPSAGTRARAKLDRIDQKIENAPRELFKAAGGNMFG